MFKKTSTLLLGNKNLPKPVQDIINMPISKTIKNAFKSNEDILKYNKLPYELRGEYLPRRPINPYKKKPMHVIYDQHHYLGFVLPSKREYAYGVFDQEELFGIRKWRNDSPLMKEYIRIDNQLILLWAFVCLAMVFLSGSQHTDKTEAYIDMLKNQTGIFNADDVKDNI